MSVPTNQSSKKNVSCYPPHIRHLINSKAKAWKKHKTSPNNVNKKTCKFIAFKCSHAIVAFHSCKESELIIWNNTRRFYKFINSRVNHRASMLAIYCPDGSLTSDNSAKAKFFNDFFSSVFIHNELLSPSFNNRTGPDKHYIRSIDFSPSIVCVTLQKLKPSTSVGPDALPNILLKRCANALVLPLYHIFDRFF